MEPFMRRKAAAAQFATRQERYAAAAGTGTPNLGSGRCLTMISKCWRNPETEAKELGPRESRPHGDAAKGDSLCAKKPCTAGPG
jgi:hypothetical protein